MAVKMKFLHTADLHIGRVLNEFSLLEDQKFVLEQMLEAAEKYRADAFVIAGDVYDRSVPAAEAVGLLDSFITALSEAGVSVLMVAGNHDSGRRLGFGEDILARQGVHIAGTKEKGIRRVWVKDVCFDLLPFLRPAQADVATSQEAVARLLEGQTFVSAKGRVLVTHYFVTCGTQAPELSDSETTLQVGGIDNVDVSAFKAYDYVALGHIHKHQRVGEGNAWYAGTPLAYSFSEDSGKKGMNLVTIEGRQVEVERLPLRPLHALRTEKGNLEELLEKGERLRCLQDPAREDYLRAILTDEGQLLAPMAALRSVYPNVMQILREEPVRGGKESFRVKKLQVGMKDLESLFFDFFSLVRGRPMEERQRAVVAELVREMDKEIG